MPFLAEKSGAKLPYIDSIDARVASAEEAAEITTALQRLIAVLVKQYLAPENHITTKGERHDE